jgi:hypothetical protein
MTFGLDGDDRNGSEDASNGSGGWAAASNRRWPNSGLRRKRRAEKDDRLVIDVASGRAIAAGDELTGTDPDTVHDILKRTDVWFGYQSDALGEAAKKLAADQVEL